jgi:hypothetical protein
MIAMLDSLVTQICAFIGACSEVEPPTEERFNELALASFNFQFEHNEAYGRLCRHQRISPQSLRRWEEIPAVITSACKELELSALPPTERSSVFHSSGTTEQKPSRHYHNPLTLRLYEHSLLTWFKPNFMPDRERLHFQFLTPRRSEAPNSSLVHMFETVARDFGATESAFFGTLDEQRQWTLNWGEAERALRHLAASREPIAICGTAFLFVHLCDWLKERKLTVQLPPGSRALETGGYKGRSRSVEKSELHKMITSSLGVPREQIISEYGMSELSSQAYDRATNHFLFPPWARAIIISPETAKPVPKGQPGLLRVYDLANVGSVMAIQTEDLAVFHGDGFELLGRASRAEARGCSLASA